MWTGTVYDCQECGACCVKPTFCEGTGYVWLSRDEAKRMKRLSLTVVQEYDDTFLGTRSRAGRKVHSVCVALSGEVGGSCGCSVYSDRPRACREFQVGSKGCLACRSAAGLPV